MSRRGWCQHYNGLMGPGMVDHPECRAGVRYDTIGISHKPPRAFPCVGEGGSCAKREPYTEEQLAEQNARVELLLARLASGHCPTCDKPIEPSTIHGRCKYGACGHRIGQVAVDDGDE